MNLYNICSSEALENENSDVHTDVQKEVKQK